MRHKGDRIAVDIAMAVVFVAVMATALVQEAPHEYLGVALFALVVAHVVLNRRWLKAMPRGRYSAFRVVQLAARRIARVHVGAGCEQPGAVSP